VALIISDLWYNDNRMEQQYFIAIAAALVLINIWVIFKLVKLDKVRKEFYSTSIEKDFEQVLVDQNRSLTKINQTLDELNSRLTDLSALNKNNIKKTGFVRFNHIDGSGGNLSFALAVLNEHDNGMVISSLHGREGVRVYAKKIESKKSESKLTQQEIDAINQAN
jgi:hypothetical protein